MSPGENWKKRDMNHFKCHITSFDIAVFLFISQFTVCIENESQRINDNWIGRFGVRRFDLTVLYRNLLRLHWTVLVYCLKFCVPFNWANRMAWPDKQIQRAKWMHTTISAAHFSMNWLVCTYTVYLLFQIIIFASLFSCRIEIVAPMQQISMRRKKRSENWYNFWTGAITGFLLLPFLWLKYSFCSWIFHCFCSMRTLRHWFSRQCLNLCCMRSPEARIRIGTSPIGLMPLAASATGTGIRSRVIGKCLKMICILVHETMFETIISIANVWAHKNGWWMKIKLDYMRMNNFDRKISWFDQ